MLAIRHHNVLAVAITSVALLLAGPLAAQEPEDLFHLVDIEPGVFALVTNDEVNASSYANVIFLEGSAGTMVIDTQHRPAGGRLILRVLRERGSAPVRWVVNSHWHSDHTLGNSVLMAAFPDAELIAHPATRDSLASGGERSLNEQQVRMADLVTRIQAALDGGELSDDDTVDYREALEARSLTRADLDTTTVVLPQSLVADRRDIDLGGRTVTILHPGPAHTSGDLVVWDPANRFLAAGDLLEEAPLWLVGADVEGWSHALTRLADLQPGKVLPAHGRVRSDIRLLQAHQALLERAVRVSHLDSLGEAGWLAEFTDLESTLVPFNVSDEDFRTYILDAIRRLRSAREGAPQPEKSHQSRPPPSSTPE